MVAVKMSLKELYPKEWEEITQGKVPRDEINKYLLKFVARLLKEVKEGKREEIDLGDGFSIGKFAMVDESKYSISPDLANFLNELGKYHVEILGGEVESSMNSIEEVELELKEVAKKLRITLDL